MYRKLPDKCSVTFRGFFSQKAVIITLNTLLVAAAVCSVIIFSVFVDRRQEQATLDAFVSAVESMKDISENYLLTERTAAKNWAYYIENKDLDLDGALDYIRSANAQQDIHFKYAAYV